MNFQLKITFSKNKQAVILRTLKKLLSADRMHEVEKRTQEGVVIIRDLNERTANSIAAQLKHLERLGVTREVTRMKGEESNELYLVRLISVGKSKLSIVKLVRELTGLGLKESKEIVDKLGIVAEDLIRNEAERFKKLLEDAGAKVRIEKMEVKDPEPEPEPKPEPEDPNKEFLVRFLSVGKHKLRVVKMIKELTKLALKESKDVADRLGVVAENLGKKEAERFKKLLEDAGAKVR